MEAIASRLKAIATRGEVIASRLDAIAIRLSKHCHLCTVMAQLAVGTYAQLLTRD